VPNRVVAYRKSFLDGGQRAPRTGPRGLIISMPVYYAGGDGTTGFRAKFNNGVRRVVG
jgi:hypothetical protein